MAEMTKTEMLKIVNESISKLKDKTFKIYFFILDTKGNPSSSLEYIYNTALVLNKNGYNVGMLHQDENFVGVNDWLGEEYANLPHYNIDKENVEIGPSDFLFIPEIFANVMVQTKKLPCKRIVIVQNFNNLCEFMPISQTPYTLGITDSVVITEQQKKKMEEYFPEIRCKVVTPTISNIFRSNDYPRKLIVNIISKDQTNINRIIKPFYWKNQMYNWVSFRDLRGLSQEQFSEALRDTAITIWIDDETTFGYTLLESLKSGNVVLAKTPNNPSDWMLDKNGDLTDSVLWFDSIDELPNILPTVIRSWTLDMIPEEVYEKQNELSKQFNEEKQNKELLESYQAFFDKRLKDFSEVLTDVENNMFKTIDE